MITQTINNMNSNTEEHHISYVLIRLKTLIPYVSTHNGNSISNSINNQSQEQFIKYVNNHHHHNIQYQFKTQNLHKII